MYDLLLKGGNVIDPSQDLRGALDVAVEDGEDRQSRREHPGRGGSTGRRRPGQDRDTRPHRPPHARLRRRGGQRRPSRHRGRARRASRRSSTRAARAARPSARFRATSCRSARPRSSRSCTSARPGSPRTPTSSPRARIDLESTLRVAREHRGLIKGIKARMVSPALEIFGHGDAALGQARGARERRAADGAHRRHRPSATTRT